MQNLINQVDQANLMFAKIFEPYKDSGINQEQYVRYLQMQYHLTNGVQETFLHIASHPDTRKYKKLRKFLVNFGYEEEMHYKLAEHDLADLGATPGEIPFPVELWWQYQKHVVKYKPIERLGATAVLENIGNYAAPIIKQVMSNSAFLSKKNTTFVQVHMHEELPHGDQIFDALSNERWSDLHLAQLEEGARRATWLYVTTIFEWIINGQLKLISCA